MYAIDKKNISIFLSSTFKDMQAERDWIKKIVLPKLQDTLYLYGINVQVTDLRWGIDTTSEREDKKESKILHICLDAIERDKPYFIGLLGDRYGWIPPKERVHDVARDIDCDSDCSVTELEMIYGALGNSDLLEHSFFFYRDSGVYNSIPDEYLPVYVETEEYKKAKLGRLKASIDNRLASVGQRAISYNAKWDTDKNTICGLEDFGNKVYDALLNDILEYESSKLDISPDQYEEKIFDAFASRRIYGFCGREDIVNEIYRCLSGYNPLEINDVNGWFLIGDSGYGKSAVLCKVYDRLLQDKDDNYIILANAAGLTESSRNPNMVLERWISQLSVALDDIPSRSSGESLSRDEVAVFNSLILIAVSRGFKPIVLLDSYDSMAFSASSNTVLKDLSFIPFCVPFLCTATPGCTEKLVDKFSNYNVLHLNGFTREEAVELITRTLKRGMKEISDKQIEIILEKKCENGVFAYSSPLWLRLVLSVLDELSDSDFRAVNNEKFERDDMKIASYITRLLNSFNPDPGRLFNQFVELSCSFFDSNVVRNTVRLAALSHEGVLESEIAEVCGDAWNQLEFNGFVSWIKGLLRKNSLTGRWNLEHNILKKSIERSSEDSSQSMRSAYIDVLLDNERSDNSSDSSSKELMFQIIKNNNLDAFKKFTDSSSDYFYGHLLTELYREGLEEDDIVQFIEGCFERKDISSELFYWITDLIIESEIGNRTDLILDALAYLEENKSYLADPENYANYQRLQYELFKVSSPDEKEKIVSQVRNACLAIFNVRGKRVLTWNNADTIRYMLCEYASFPYDEYLRAKRTDLFIDVTGYETESCRRWCDVIRFMKSVFKIDESREKELYRDAGLDQLDYYSRQSIDAIMGEFSFVKYNPSSREYGKSDFSHYLEEWDEYKRQRELRDNQFGETEEEQMNDMYQALREIKGCGSKDNDMYCRLAKVAIHLADDYLMLWEPEKANKVVDIVFHMASSRLVRIPELDWVYDSYHSTYGFALQSLEPVTSLAKWLITNNRAKEAEKMLLKIYCKSLRSVASCPKGKGLVRLRRFLRDLYCNVGKFDEAASLYGIYWTLVMRNPVPENVHGASVRCAYEDYMNILRQTSNISAIEECESEYNDYVALGYNQEESHGTYARCRVSANNEYIQIGEYGDYQESFKWGVMNKDEKVIVKPQYDEISYYSDGLAMVGNGVYVNGRPGYYAVGMRYGYIDTDGVERIPMIFEYASPFYKGEALVYKNNKFYYIDTCGNTTKEITL